ncbi:MAG: UTP--glucose-1-phosphate uridylyltransferase [Pseudomonadota bacterium]
MNRVTTAVFPVAGLGTRFLPVTKSVPKELLPVHDRPLIEYAVEEAREAGIERFVFVNSRSKQALEDHFRPAPALEAELERKGKKEALAKVRNPILGNALRVVYQDVPLGLGHAVSCARDIVGDQPFAVLLPDDFLDCQRPCLAQMVHAWRLMGGNMVATVDVGREAISSYGCLDVTHTEGRLLSARGMVEKPKANEAPSTHAVIGRYILQPSVMRRLKSTQPGAGGEIQLTDAIAADISSSGLFGFAFSGTRYDCGQPAGMAAATSAMAAKTAGSVRLAA